MSSTQEVSTQHKDNGLAVASMVLGTLSVAGFGFFLGIPAIILASIALKNKTEGRNLSIAGLVTGIVGTVLSLLFATFIILMIILSPSYDDEPYYPPRHDWSNFDNPRT